MSNPDKIQAEVELRNQKAWKLELPQTVTEFYLEHARFYPLWKESEPVRVPRSLVDIEEGSDDAVEFTYSGDRYVITWNESDTTLPDGAVDYSSTIELFINGDRVLEVYLVGDFNIYTGMDWKVNDVRAFIGGPWVKAFKTLAAEGERLYALEEKRAEDLRKKEELAELQTRFGITTDKDSSWLQRIFKKFLKQTNT